jgi:monoterpene epsilon-lactone hydrolase
MSLRAEFVRLGLRWLIKRGNRHTVTVARHREQIARFERWMPTPPADAEIGRGDVGGVASLRVGMRAARRDRDILFLHGGGYVAGSAALYRHFLWRLAAAADAQVTAIDYRLAPEHPFPAALDDAIGAWHGLLAEGTDPGRTVVIGDSAGGGLALAAGMRLRDRGDALPAAIVALSPWTDLAATGLSLATNADADPMLIAAAVPTLAACYLAGADPRDPGASPLYGDPAGLPPSLIQVGSDEILRDDALRMAERMRAADCAVELEIWPRMPHVWHLFAPLMPEAGRAINRIGAFVRQQTIN